MLLRRQKSGHWKQPWICNTFRKSQFGSSNTVHISSLCIFPIVDLQYFGCLLLIFKNLINWFCPLKKCARPLVHQVSDNRVCANQSLDWCTPWMLCLAHSATLVHERLQTQTQVRCHYFFIDSASVLKYNTLFLGFKQHIFPLWAFIFCLKFIVVSH